MASWQLSSNNFQASNHLWIYTCVCVHGGQAGDWSKIANKATRAFCTSVSIVRVQFYGTAHRYCTCDMSRSCATKFLQVVYARHAERIATESKTTVLLPMEWKMLSSSISPCCLAGSTIPSRDPSDQLREGLVMYIKKIHL